MQAQEHWHQLTTKLQQQSNTHGAALWAHLAACMNSSEPHNIPCSLSTVGAAGSAKAPANDFKTGSELNRLKFESGTPWLKTWCVSWRRRGPRDCTFPPLHSTRSCSITRQGFTRLRSGESTQREVMSNSELRTHS